MAPASAVPDQVTKTGWWQVAGSPQQVGLGPVDGGSGTASRALKIAGVHWSLPR